MPKISECDRCLLCAHNPRIVCDVHPLGVENNTCLDFRPAPNTEPEKLWESEVASYYNGELIKQPKQRLTPEEKLALLDYHPIFTGRCPNCEMPYPKDKTRALDWDCFHCGWVDDRV